MNSTRHSTILTVFLVFVFVGSAIFGIPRVAAASVTGLNPASTVVNPVSAPNMLGFKQAALASSFPVIVNIAIPLNNISLLESMESQISNPSSPEYRQFLSQETIQQTFLPVAKYDSTLTYLQSKGFTILDTYEDSIIVASATVSLLQSALGLSTAFYSNGTIGYYASSGAPSVAGIYVYCSNVTGLVVQHADVSYSSVSASPQKTSSSVPNVTSPDEGFDAADLRSAYNSASLVASGANGKGMNIGIFEYYGDTYIQNELTQYDAEEGLANPPSFVIVPVGPYNPNAGVVTGASVEVALDAEVSHAMAPGAGITMYVGNGALPWAPIIAAVDEQDVVNVLTQSWFNPEIYYPYEGPSFLLFNTILTDQYFALGSAEGITFSVASGDRGGTGFAGQPAAAQGWPASSPYVTSIGGTQTYLAFDGSTVTSTYQTDWSNEGFEPTLANFGGATGGVSNLEPKPWYQDAISTPSSYGNGRIEPDVSLNAGIWPGVYEVLASQNLGSSAGYTTILEGGTSEASPLFAGLIVDIDSKIDGSLGLINPVLYQLGENPSLYPKYFIPITFGYGTPWTDSYGFNLANGWGAPNIGNLANYFMTAGPTKSVVSDSAAPSVQITIENSSGMPQYEFAAGQKIKVIATVTGSVSSDTFTAQLETLQGTLVSVKMTYSTSDTWKATITVPATASGISNVNVIGTVSGEAVEGSASVFTGYLATVSSPAAFPGDLPWSTIFGFPVTVQITDLDGNVISTGSYSFTTYTYSVSTNEYSALKTQPLSYSAGVWSNEIAPYNQTGPMNILLNGVFGYIPFIDSVGLTGTYILPLVNAEPGTVSPGQSLKVEGEIQAPINTPDIISEETGLPVAENIDILSNLTASLVSPSGHVVSTDSIGAVEVPFLGGPIPYSQINYLGFLTIPANSKQGLYDIRLNSIYESIDLDMNVTGSYFGQVYVSGQPAIVPKITLSPNPVGEGKTLTIKANIAYANGTEVKYGMYSATLYPAYDSNNYPAYSAYAAGEIPLTYNSSLNLWEGTVTMPGPTSLGWIGGITYFVGFTGTYAIVSTPVSGQWDAFVSGLSADGVPTTTAQSAQVGFTVSA